MSESKEKMSTAVQVMNNEIVAFKVPSNVPAPRKKKKVLDEDTYVEKLESIIQRDFFPDLKKLKVQAEYLEALETNDVAKLREIYEKYSAGPKLSDGQSRLSSPATFETPARDFDAESVHSSSSKISASSSKSNKPSEKHESLDQFLYKHTSEDNESFEEMMDEAKKRHRIKYAWLYETENNSQAKQESALALPSIEQQALEGNKPAILESWNYTVNNSIMYVPEGAPLTIEEKVKLAFDKEHVCHASTRFQSNPFDEERNREALQKAAQQQVNVKQGHVDVLGKEIKPNPPPNAKGFEFLKTPSPAPGVTDTPLMTWGEIEGTPFRLDGSDTPLPSSSVGVGAFQLQPISDRDRIGLKLAEKVGKGYRDRRARAKPGNTPLASPYGGNATPKTPGTISQRISQMSPAARRLATSRLGIRLSTDPALQASYTPRHRPSGTPTPKSDRTPLTPRIASASPLVRSKTSGSGANLTDNLLQLPKRGHAKDFF